MSYPDNSVLNAVCNGCDSTMSTVSVTLLKPRTIWRILCHFIIVRDSLFLKNYIFLSLSGVTYHLAFYFASPMGSDSEKHLWPSGIKQVSVFDVSLVQVP